MAMEQIGYVVGIENGRAKIRVDRQSACGGNCSGCHGCMQEAVFVYQEDDPTSPFQVGERVRLVMQTGSFFSGIFQSYGFMILTFFVGAILGYRISNREIVSVAGGFLGLLLGGALVHFCFKKKQPKMSVIRMENKV